MVNSTPASLRPSVLIYNSRNLYGQFDQKESFDALCESTTVEIYMVNSTNIR